MEQLVDLFEHFYGKEPTEKDLDPAIIEEVKKARKRVEAARERLKETGLVESDLVATASEEEVEGVEGFELADDFKDMKPSNPRLKLEALPAPPMTAALPNSKKEWWYGRKRTRKLHLAFPDPIDNLINIPMGVRDSANAAIQHNPPSTPDQAIGDKSPDKGDEGEEEVDMYDLL